jgi:hypothetical protein
MSDPQIPAALAPVVMGLKALNDFHPRPMHKLGNRVQFNSSTGMWQRISGGSSPTLAIAASSKPPAANPEFGITVPVQGGSVPLEDVTPWDFAAIYNVLPLWNGGTPIDGTGQTIAIVATSDINPADVASYRSVFGLPAGPPLQTIIANGVDPGRCIAQFGDCTIDDLYENTLDAEVSGGVAKGAQIDLVVSGPTSPTTDTVYSSASYVVENNTAKIMSVSYGLCELFMGTSGNAAYNNLFETAAVEGIGVSIATGDAGSPACDQGLATSLPYGAQFGLSVSGLASSPYDTAVGGTDFAWCKPTVTASGQVIGCSTVTPHWNTTNHPTTGASAAGYVPEIPWNDSCASSPAAAYGESVATFVGISGVTDAEKACNFIVNNYISIRQQYGVDLSYFVDAVGGGGGASNCTVNSTTGSTVMPDPTSCSGGYSKPSWQAGVTGIPSDGKRDIPDVSFFSGAGLWNSATIVCVSEAGACVTSTTTTTEPTGQEVGGTSVAAPEMAGVMALINQKAGSAQGNPNAELYALAAKQTYSTCSAATVTASSSCYFNDVNTSTNAMPCRAGAPNCTISHTGDTWGILSGFNATTGFDEATGLGSLNVANVVNGWTSLLGTTPATVTVTPAQNTISLDQSLQVVVTVQGASGTPTGNVTIAGGGYNGGAQTLASGSYTFTIPAFSLGPGAYKLTGSYQGDSTYAEASSTASITVNKILPTVTVALNPSTIGANTPITANITVAGGPGSPAPTGTVQLTAGTWYAYCPLGSGSCSITIPVNVLPNGSDTVTVSYPGDGKYLSATGTAPETVNALTATIKAAASPSSFNADAPFTVNVNITGSGPVPSGQVSLGLLVNGYQPIVLQGQLTNGAYLFNVPPDSVYAGQNRVQLSYAGDSTYLPGGIDVPITVTAGPTTTTVNPSSTNIYTNTPLTLSGTVSASFGTPSSNVIASFASYTGLAPLINGQYSITIPPGTLPVGSDTINVNYMGDSFYASSTASTTVNVTQWTKIAPTITITPAATTIGAGMQLGVAVAISGSGGQGTGTVTLSSGSWNVGPWAVVNGTSNLTVPSNTLPVGTDTLTAAYSGDSTYLAGSASVTITVNPSTFSLAPDKAALSVTRGQQGFDYINAHTSDGYGGTISLTCALTSQPSGAVNLPTCSGGTISLTGGGVQTNSYLAVVSTTATSASIGQPVFPGLARLGGATLAFLVFLGIPAHRRGWRSLLGVLIVLFVFAGLNACGGSGGGGNGGGGGGNTSGTTPGSYVFTVTGTGNPPVTPAPTTTFTVTVN